MKKPRHQPKPKQELIDVTIEKMVPNGAGLGHIDGLTVMVPLVAPGDTVRVLTGKRNGNLVFAQLEKFSSRRRGASNPDVNISGKCGGCNFQQLSYEDQLAAKVGIVQDCLHRIAKLQTLPEINIVASPQPWNYRSRANWHADTSEKKLGYFYRNTNKVCDIDECPILIEPLQQELSRLQKELAWQDLWANIAHIDASSASGEISLRSDEIAEVPRDISFQSSGFDYTYSANVFFQGNPYVTPLLVDAAVKDVSGDLALDLYCGVGLFTLPLAKNFTRVIGVEENPNSIEYAKKNSAKNGLDNAQFHSADVGRWLSGNAEALTGLDALLLDPPRVGVEKDVIRSIIELAPREIVYVSCDPATLARDLRALFEKYELLSVQAFDMFPQTHHVETIAKLKSRK